MAQTSINWSDATKSVYRDEVDALRCDMNRQFYGDLKEPATNAEIKGLQNIGSTTTPGDFWNGCQITCDPAVTQGQIYWTEPTGTIHRSLTDMTDSNTEALKQNAKERKRLKKVAKADRAARKRVRNADREREARRLIALETLEDVALNGGDKAFARQEAATALLTAIYND